MYKSGFITIYQDGIGYVKRHIDVDTLKRDYEILEIIAIEKAKMGCCVEILPEIMEKEIELRMEILPDVIGFKNPDLRIDGKYVEVKALESNSKNAVERNIKSAHEQAHHIILNLPGNWDKHDLYRLAKGKLKTMESLGIIEFRNAGKYYIYDRKDFEY